MTWDTSRIRLTHLPGILQPATRSIRITALCLFTGLLLGMAGSVRADTPDSGAIPDSCSVVVKLFGAGIGNLDAYGSATLISPDGHLVTVWNHLINTGYLTAVTSDGRRFPLEVIGTSADHDLAVLQLRADRADEFPHIDRNATVRPEAGTAVHAFSNMFHVATGNEPVSVVHGIVAANTELQAEFGRWTLPLKSPVVILDAITNNSGAAGGLVTDVAGSPVGLLGRELRHSHSGAWVNYAVPFETLNPIIDRILAGESITAETSETTPRPLSSQRLTTHWGFTLVPDVLKETPAYVDRVVPDSPADTAGLQRGDLIILVDEEVIQTSEDLRTQLARIRSGLRVTITVNRDGALNPIDMRAP